MNQAHLHLLLNHLPILGSLFGILTLLAGFLLKNDTVKRTALGLFAVAAITAIPAYLTGESAEEVVESMPGVTENLIEAHEDMANIFLWVVGALGLLSLATLYADFKAQRITSTLYIITFAVSIAAMGLAARVGITGGEIRHTEIRNDATASAANGAVSPNASRESGKDEDDD
ncbi:MAG: hypothetical protein IT270_02535 [Saprospiraceae bacterium]|nr:hypothetical protein [Saprospiraceae bacterium]